MFQADVSPNLPSFVDPVQGMYWMLPDAAPNFQSLQTKPNFLAADKNQVQKT